MSVRRSSSATLMVTTASATRTVTTASALLSNSSMLRLNVPAARGTARAPPRGYTCSQSPSRALVTAQEPRTVLAKPSWGVCRQVGGAACPPPGHCAEPWGCVRGLRRQCGEGAWVSPRAQVPTSCVPVCASPSSSLTRRRPRGRELGISGPGPRGLRSHPRNVRPCARRNKNKNSTLHRNNLRDMQIFSAGESKFSACRFKCRREDCANSYKYAGCYF